MNPPKRALQFLRWFCREDYLDEIEGDLTEVFKKQYESSPRKAKWKFSMECNQIFQTGIHQVIQSKLPRQPYCNVSSQRTHHLQEFFAIQEVRSSSTSLVFPPDLPAQY